MKATQKVTVTLAKVDIEWARAKAKATGTNLSIVIGDALRKQRQAEARQKLLSELAD